MAGLVPYLFFPGTARQALEFYRSIFGGDLIVNTYADFDRTDGPGDAVAHAMLTGPVQLFGSDVAGDQPPVAVEGVMFSLLGTAQPEALRTWFLGLADGGRVVDPLQPRPWGASDGQVVDRFGVHWLIGFEGDG
jgi:PhnB protein